MDPRTAAIVPTLPGRFYWDPDLYRSESEEIFARLWMCVGLAASLPQPGDFLTTEVAGEPLLVVRGQDRELRAFLNVCRHRGARLCTEPCGHLTGHVIQCPYHAWSYALDGRLIGAPNMRDAAGFAADAYGLHPIPLAIWHGLIWVNLSDDPPPVESQLVPPILERFGETETFERYRIGDLAVGASITYDVAANWKLVVENFMECYHCAVVHPELSRLVPSFRAGQAYQQGVGATFAEGVETLTLTGRRTRPLLPGLRPEDDRTYYGLVLRPNVFVNLHPDYVLIHRLEPLAPDRTRIVCDWLFAPEVVSAPDFDPSDAVEFWDLVNRQDWEMCERCQLSMHSRAYAEGGIFAPIEAHIRRFNDWVLEQLGVADN
ncbi:aromatic ring-hydroxylating dioxygenase subunit alpha [Thermomicrobium sp. CFH 73360]|uniref:aromatic ring-hydroxylating oxygenase subunit alpha n=1 Tax=Thermomicrobium sp. CFH 73360 TaxID=2951987 RepID=UPI0020777058|nr:aromatic ring-hydroxylating dioxygenase subunit alpha [Thermomicrobium sp. CFH 73360]